MSNDYQQPFSFQFPLFLLAGLGYTGMWLFAAKIQGQKAKMEGSAWDQGKFQGLEIDVFL